MKRTYLMKLQRIMCLTCLMVIVMAAGSAVGSDGGKKNLNVFIQSDHTDYPKFLFMSQDKTILGSVGGHSDVKLWDVRSGLLIKTIRIKQSFLVFTAAISPDNRLLATGGGDGVLRLWDMDTGAPGFEFKETTKSVTDIVFTRNGKYVVYGSEDFKVRVCDINKGNIIKSRYCDSFPNALAERPENGHIVVGCFHGEIYEYSSPESGFTYQYMMGAHSKPVEAVAIAPDGTRMVTTGQDNRSMVWKREQNGRKAWVRMKTYKARDVSDSFSLALEGFFTADFSPDGKTFCFAGQDERLWVCDSSNGNIFKRYRIHSSIDSIVYTDPDSLAVVRSGAKKIQTYRIRAGKRLEVFSGNTVPVTSLAAGRDFMITIDKNETAFVWSIPDFSMIRTFPAKNGCINRVFGRNVAITPDSSLYAVTHGKGVDLVDGKTHKIITNIAYNSYEICSLSLAPDGKYLVFLSGTQTVLWNITENKKVFSESSYLSESKCPAISPDSKTLVYAKSDSDLRLYDLVHHKDISKIPLPASVISLAFSPDSRLIAAGCADKNIRLLDSRTGAVTRTLSGHKGYSFADIAWSPDGRTLASSNQNAEFLLWDTGTWTIKKNIRTHFGDVNALGFTRDGRYVISGGDDGSVRLHSLDSYENVISLFGLPKGEWAAISGKGYYNASDGGGEFINANSGLHVSRIDSYASAYFRPDLIPLILSGKKTDSFQSAGEEKTPPVSRLLSVPEKTDKDTVTLSVSTTDTGGGIGKTVVYLNGSAIQSREGRGLKAVRKNKAVVFTYEITLNPGTNEIKVVTFNASNTVEGNPAYARIQYTAPKPVGTRMVGLVIGIDAYRNPNLNLKYAAKDAALFAETLSTKGKSLFSNITLQVMTRPENTSKKAILKALTSYQNLAPNDLFVFYVAAHGVVDEGEFFLLTSDVGHLSSKKLRKDALSQVVLKDIVSNIPSTKKLIVLDTCNSQALGNALESAFLTRGLSESTAVKLLSRSTGSTILSASKTGQEAIEGYKDHGLFTYTIAQALNGQADMNKDGFIKTTELADFVEETVTELSEAVFKKPQFPVVSRSGQSFPVSAHR